MSTVIRMLGTAAWWPVTVAAEILRGRELRAYQRSERARTAGSGR